MESELGESDENVVDVENISVSDSEETSTLQDLEFAPLNIDYNSRIASREVHGNFDSGDDCDMRFSQKRPSRSGFVIAEELSGDTSSEELEVSDEDVPKFTALTLQSLEGIACIANSRHLDSLSTLKYSSNILKDECSTDTEYISDESDKDILSFGKKKCKDMLFGLSAVGLVSTVSKVFPKGQNILSHGLSNSTAINNENLLDVCEDQLSPLLTCLEFLKSEHSEDDETDVEEFSLYSVCTNGDSKTEVAKETSKCIKRPYILDDGLKYCGTVCGGNGSSNEAAKTLTKRTSHTHDCDVESLTDEEFIDVDNKEWTETDESGGVRQITQIKTETSIKLEGDGAVRSLRKVPEKKGSDEEGKHSTDSEQEDLSFTEKKSFFQRLSLTSDSLPSNNKWTQDVSLDDLPMAEGEIVSEQISFEDKLKMFEPDEDNRKKIQKRDKPEQPTVYRYDFTKSTKDKPEYVASELEKAEEIVKHVNEEINVEERLINDPSFGLSDLGADFNSVFTLEKVEQEVSSLLAEVDKEEKELSSDFYGVSSTRSDDDLNNEIESVKLSKTNESEYVTESHGVTDNVSPGQNSLIFERDALIQDGEKKTAYEIKTLVDEKAFVPERSIEVKTFESQIEEETITPDQEQLKMESSAFASHDPFACGESLNSEIEELSERKFSIELCKKEEFKEALKLEEDYSTEEVLKCSADRPSKLATVSAVDSHIKSEILQEEIDQSIEESPLEVKQISEEIERISASEDHKCNVYKHIRTEIFTQELGEVIESGSPERKELGAFSSKNVTSPSKSTAVERDTETDEELHKSASNVVDTGFNESPKALSSQISDESIDPTDELSSEGVVVEPDEHLVEYEEAKAEHSLTEQLQALASDSMHCSKSFISDVHQVLDFSSHDFDHMSSAMSSGMSDLDLHRRTKDIPYSRHDKKEIRSLKSTKQVSTIEEHSSIESCDSPQELMLQELPDKCDQKEIPYGDDHKELKDQESIVEELSETNNKSGYVMSTDAHKQTDAVLMSDADKNISFGTEVSSEPDLPLKQSESTSDKFEKLPRSDSKSSHGRKSDSDAEGSKLESTPGSSDKRKEESCSSSGETESPYYSVETSDSGRTPRSTPVASRPCSSEFEINVFSGHGSEYETCVTSQEASGSYATAVSSQEISYATACSSFSHSSRESGYSVDSESSGHLASVEVSSEASETLVPSAQEMELEFIPDFEMPVLDEEPAFDDPMKEPYDMEIPEAIIRGGIELPFMKSWDLKDAGTDTDEKMKQLPQQWTWQYAAESEILDNFEVLENNDVTEAEKASILSVADVQTFEEGSKLITQVSAKEHIHPQIETASREGTSHRRSFSSVTDIVPEKEHAEQISAILDEEQLSVSESSATHSEQTWQTTSIDTAVQLSTNVAASCLATDSINMIPTLESFQETPPEKELISEQSTHIQSSYLQLNGPVEVEYVPGYDNPDGDDSELRSNQDQSALLYETEGLQFELEIEGSVNTSNTSHGAIHFDSSINVQENASEPLELNGVNSHFTSSSSQSIPPSSHYESHNNGTSLDAEKPEAQQEHFSDYDRVSDSMICPDLTSYLPESDQCDLLPSGADSLPPSYESEINIPCGESLSSSEGLSNVEKNTQHLFDPQNTDSIEKTDIVDTSPEDERYEYKSVKQSSGGKLSEDEKSEDLHNVSATLKFGEADGAEICYVPQSFSSKYDEVSGNDLYTHHEEEEFDLRESDVYPSPIPSIEDDKQSTPSSDVLHSRRFFPRSGDTSAASSLQEFERLETEIAAGRLSRSSIDSGEKVITKSSEHDDVSMSSLTEFEKLEKEFVENEQDSKLIVDDIMLSEIEEGLESQCSDAIEILHESVHEGSDSSEYERRRIDIEEIIKVAQSNVEKFHEETTSEGITSDECTVVVRGLSQSQDASETAKISSRDEGNTDIEECEPFPLTSELDNIGGQDSSSSGDKNCGNGKLDCMISSTDSMDPSSSTATHATYQFETDSVMSSSINSAQASGEECTMVSSTDTLEPEPKLTYSHGDTSSQEKTHVSGNVDEPLVHSKGALACKLEELQASNGAKEQMEMFLSKLTDESILMDDFTCSLPDRVADTEQHTAPDDFLKSFEAVQGFSSSGEGSAVDGDDLISRTTATTTTRIVTTVTTDQEDGETEQQTTGENDLQHSVEVILNQFMTDDSVASKQDDSSIDHEE